MKKDGRVKSGLSAAIRENLALGDQRKPWTELAQSYGVKLATVYRRVAEQRSRDKKLKQLENAAKLGSPMPYFKPNPPNSTSRSFEALFNEAASSPTMPREERLKVLSVLAKSAPDAVKVAAIAKLEEFERAAGQQFGPPPPTTDEEVISYLCDLFDGLNLELIQEAITRVFTTTKPEITENTENGAADPGASDLGGRPPGGGLRRETGESDLFDGNSPRTGLASPPES